MDRPAAGQTEFARTIRRLGWEATSLIDQLGSAASPEPGAVVPPQLVAAAPAQLGAVAGGAVGGAPSGSAVDQERRNAKAEFEARTSSCLGNMFAAVGRAWHWVRSKT